MKKVEIFLILLATLMPAKAAYITKEIMFSAPTVPKIEKPACAKVEILKKVTVPAQATIGVLESFEFTYMVTLEPGCRGTLTFISTYDSSSNHHAETIKKSYTIKKGALIVNE